MDCENCIHNGGIVIGSSHHISCNACGETMKAKMSAWYWRNFLAVEKDGKKLPLVKLSSHGVSNGWCEWPINFHSIWIEECNLRIEKNENASKEKTTDGGA